MDKLDVEEMTIEEKASEFPVKVILYSYGSYKELEVNVYENQNDRWHEKYIFRVRDEEDRTCGFRKSRPTEVGEPSDVALKAVAKYGYFCESHSAEPRVPSSWEQIQGTLETVDQMLGGVLQSDDEIIADYPLFADMIEAGQTQVAEANAILVASGQDPYSEGARDGFKRIFDDPEMIEKTLTESCLRDPYSALVLPELAKFHHGIELGTHSNLQQAIEKHPILSEVADDLRETDRMHIENFREGSYGDAHSPDPDDI